MKSTKSRVPTGDKQLLINIKKELHTDLKLKAVKEGTTMRDIVESAISSRIKADDQLSLSLI